MPLERDPPGRKAVLYWSATLITDNSQSGIATWLASAAIAGDIYDESDNLEPEYADITTRKKASGGFTARKPIIREGEMTFDFSWETNNLSDQFVQALIDASNNEQATQGTLHDQGRLALVSLDYKFDDPNLATGEITQGPAGNWYPSFSKASAIRDAQRGSATVVGESFVTWYKSAPAP